MSDVVQQFTFSFFDVTCFENGLSNRNFTLGPTQPSNKKLVKLDHLGKQRLPLTGTGSWFSTSSSNLRDSTKFTSNLLQCPLSLSFDFRSTFRFLMTLRLSRSRSFFPSFNAGSVSIYSCSQESTAILATTKFPDRKKTAKRLSPCQITIINMSPNRSVSQGKKVVAVLKKS